MLTNQHPNIITPFYINILVKDYDVSDEWITDLTHTLEALSLDKDNFCAMRKNQTTIKNELIYKYEKDEVAKPYIVTEETADIFDCIKDLRQMYLECFHEYAQSYDDSITRESIEKILKNDMGNFAIIQPGGRVGIHNHPSSAFAIFYLDDVDNDKDGGELVLYDPSWNTNIGFSPKNEYRIQTKKKRMIIGPAYVWHEVVRYQGNKDRICAVIDFGRT